MKDLKITTRLYYGWWLVVISLLVMSVGAGTSLYLYSVVASSLQIEFPGSRTLLMMGATGFFIIAGLMSPKVGVLVDRYPIKWILLYGSLIMGIGYILISLSGNIYTIAIIYAVFIGIGMATLSTLTTATLLTRWFTRHRGLALGIAALGSQFGGLVYPPIFANLVETYHWRVALGILGLFIILVMPLLALLVKDYPSNDDTSAPDWMLGHKSSGEQTTSSYPNSSPSNSAIEAPTILSLIVQRKFLLLILAIGSASTVNTAVIANLSLFAVDMGESVERGAYLVSLLSILGMLSSPIVGRFCDIWNIKFVAAAMFLLSSFSSFMFLYAGSYSLLIFAASIQGFVGGSVLPLWASLVARIYHGSIYGRAMGTSTLMIFSMTALSPLFAGWIHDLTGSYHVMFVIMLGMMSTAALAVSLLQLKIE